ncbi:MAG: glycosyltransferase family 2 protein, partial [Thermoanaerobaculia bacterium]|nr:glycosyltransferase family 2 protein [Thermoanaerobaculia bacterium]
DLSTPIEDIALLEPRLDAAEVVIGSRAVAGANVVRHQPFYREVMGKTFNKLIRLAGVWGLQDTQCGFKLLDGDVARELFAELITPGFGYDVELVWLARQRGYKVAEVGITWENSPDSRVRPIVDSISVLFEIVRFRLHHARRGAQPGGAIK